MEEDASYIIRVYPYSLISPNFHPGTPGYRDEESENLIVA
jgi:hypothetical protein